jgi:hypothetical protein
MTRTLYELKFTTTQPLHLLQLLLLHPRHQLNPILSSEPHLQLTLPTDPSSYTDGTTSLTDSQI